MPDTKLDSINHEAEANREDWPAYPMRSESGLEHKGMTWDRPPQQKATVEILHSNERPNLSAVFGTPHPPSGLSGMVRRYAFAYSENKTPHWVLLMLADRINMVEGVIQDVSRGRIPNVLGEMGLKADLKYNKKGLALKAGVALAVVGGLTWLALRKPRRKSLFR